MPDRSQHTLSPLVVTGTVAAALICSALVYAGAGWVGATRTAAVVSAAVAFLAVLLGGLRLTGAQAVRLPAETGSGGPEPDPWLWKQMTDPPRWLRRNITTWPRPDDPRFIKRREE